jgi:hypothetical protein
MQGKLPESLHSKRGCRSRGAGPRRRAARCTAVEVGDAVNTEQDGLAIKDELLCSDAPGCLDDQRIAAGSVIAVTGEQADTINVPLHDQPEPVLLDLMYPIGVMGDLGPASGDAGRIRTAGHMTLNAKR